MFILERLFHMDALSMIMMVLVSFVVVLVASFSSRYLRGDRKRGLFYSNLIAMTCSVFVMVNADHLLLLLISWVVTNIFLTRLMLHKREWEAARQSSILALKNFSLGAVCFACAIGLLYSATGETSIQKIIHQSHSIGAITFLSAGLLILLTAMTQSALWPFHRWLTSSLNSPTPVSAIMHAGVVNGGGFLLARFAPLLLEQPLTLGALFFFGIMTSIVGTLWKLMQSDIKRMLACSTMGQMGFMVAQCGLGLFPAAVAHLCWHGLTKAYLFLSSGSIAGEKRLDLEYPPSIKSFVTSLFCGSCGAWAFAFISEENLWTSDTTFFLIVIVMIAGTQFALSMIHHCSITRVPIALLAVVLMGFFYGLSVSLIEKQLLPLGILAPQPMHVLHYIGLISLITAWLSILFVRWPKEKHYPRGVLKAYVAMLNASQPHPQTVTSFRNDYQS